MARVILDALAESQFVKQFQVVAGALFDALRLDQLVVPDVEIHPLAQFQLDLLDGAQGGLARRDVMTGRIDREARHLVQDLPGQRVEQGQRFDLVIKQRDAQRRLRIFRREHIQHVAADAESAAVEVVFVAVVLHAGETLDDIALADFLALGQVQHHAMVVDRIADAVDGRHGGDDHDVFPLQQRLGGREPHLLDVLVDAGILLDEHVARRHIGFRLVVVVIRHEILHRIVGQELAEFRIELRGQRFVGRHDNGRPAHLRDDIGHGVGLAGTGHAQQGLEAQATPDAVRQLFDGRRLVAGRWERLMQFKAAIGVSDDHGNTC
ncbi:hypothetical protein GALL_366800 [mine drainage metagenome]|uniref:Uncharacterized protein n=1 Tax=mine drainage metagenome TaxID=410659 RepID=A0A1J5QED0_9ZZZZ